MVRLGVWDGGMVWGGAGHINGWEGRDVMTGHMGIYLYGAS